MKHWKSGFLVMFFCLVNCVSAQYIQVNDTYSAQQLVQDVLVNSPCANVSNFSVSGDNFSPGYNSYGYFTNSSPDFPFTEGIVLSTARAFRSAGPNDNLIDEGSNSWNGDPDLQNALGLDETFNATVLEFDFLPLTSQISFDYVFASEEYLGTAPCFYSDGFAFLLKPAGSSDAYQNLAVLPNTDTPVLVTNVHPQIGTSCPAINEEYFGEFVPSNGPINYAGRTVVLTARGNVVPGTLYHIKLVIADDHNARYDSAIFLGGGTFKVGTDIGPNRLLATNNPVCEDETYVLDATESGTNTYQWFKNDIAIPGAINPTYPVVESAIYSVEINLGGTGCIARGKAEIEYTVKPVLNDPTVLVQCDENNDGITIFNLTKADDILKMGDPNLGVVTYYPTLADAQNQTNVIANPTAYQNTVNQVFARAENQFGCPGFATVNLQISNNSIANTPSYSICDNDFDGISTFTLNISDVDSDVTQGLPSGLSVQYFAAVNDALSGTNPISLASFQNTTPFSQTIYAILTNGPDCYGIVPIQLTVNTFPVDDFNTETVYVCNGANTTIDVANSYASYLWTTGETSNSIVVTTAGSYSVTVTNAVGCTATKTFTVLASEIATVNSVTVNDFTGNNNTILVNYTGVGNYEFSLDGQHYQSSPFFIGLAPGEYFVYIRDINGCGDTPPYAVTVMDYPKFFTPNGDGINDVWEIKNLDSQPDAQVTIFNRFGQLVYSFKGNGIGWNGRLRNTDLPSDDYWFTITLENGKTVKSHFSLKR